MLASACLGNDARLAHLFRQQNLADRVVDLVRPRVVQVFALQVKTASIFLAHATGVVKRRRTADIVFQQLMIRLPEILAFKDRQIGMP